MLTNSKLKLADFRTEHSAFFSYLNKNICQQDGIPVGCVPPACQLFQWPPLDVSASEGLGPQVIKFEQVPKSDVRGGGYPRPDVQ